MRKAFTLIELMIVIAIIAIIAAIAIPNLLESRITANEAAAAASLKSGVFPAQVQYQTGGYVDNDVDGAGNLTPDGRGVYACHVRLLAGFFFEQGGANNPAGSAANAAFRTDNLPNKPLQLLDPKFQNAQGQAQGGLGGLVQGAAAATARVGAYDYAIMLNCAASGAAALGPNGTGVDAAGNPLTITAEDEAESYWGALACPRDTTGNEGRRIFGVNETGTVFQSKGDLVLPNTNLVAVTAALGGAGNFWGTSPQGTIATNNPAPVGGSVPFQK